MDIVGRKKIKDFKIKHADAHASIDPLIDEMDIADWAKPQDIKNRYPKASIISGNQVVFNIRNGYYRLWVKVNYKNGIILVKKVGTHNEYNKWEII